MRLHRWLILSILTLGGCLGDGEGGEVPGFGQPQGCEYQGETYEDGDEFPAGDYCNTCYCDASGPGPGQVGCTAVLCSCPNNISSDEVCSQLATPTGCVKAWGEGASYCATPCASDDDCIDVSNGPLRCHPTGGYCTPSCETPNDCYFDGIEEACTDGVCDACPNCF